MRLRAERRPNPHEVGSGVLDLNGDHGGGPGRIRTSDTRFRRAVLYPLSYEANVSSLAPGTGDVEMR